MDKKQIDRINELAKKKKSVGLTDAELKEQKALYKIYLSNIKRNFKNTLDNVVIEKADGSTVQLKDVPKKKNN